MDRIVSDTTHKITIITTKRKCMSPGKIRTACQDVKRTIFPHNRPGQLFSQLNKLYTLKGYLVQNAGNDNRNIFSYDIASDQWEFDPGTIDPYGDELTIGFVSNGKIYMLGYDTYGSQEKLYEALKLPF
jgi:hypothetical protein